MEHPWRSDQKGVSDAGCSISRRALTLGAAIFLVLLVIASVSGYQSLRQSTSATTTVVSNSLYPLNFLVVGDWGRDGGYNQRKVASQVSIY